MSKIQVPNLLDLISRRIQSTDDEAEVRNFFNIKRKPGKQWIDTLLPGLDAAQRILGAHLEEQQGPVDPMVEELCEVLFGERYIDTLEKLVKSIKENDLVRVSYEKDEEGDTRSMKVEQFKTRPVEALEKVEEPAEGLVPVATAKPASAGLLKLVEALRPRVRADNDQPEAIVQAILDGKWSRKVAMLLPIYGAVNPHIAYHWMAQIRKQPWLGVEYETETVIQRARNLLAQKFLRSEAEWSVWLDADIVAPFGDPGFFFADNRLCADPTFLKPEYAALMAIERMMKAGKTIVGGVYQMRRAGKVPMIIQPDLHPRHQEDRDLVKQLLAEGPMNKVVQVAYVATGCALVHRSVYEAIMQKFPELGPKKEGEPFDFFGHDVGTGGEDIHFGGLAKQAGHASFLDCGVWCCHVGNYPFWPQRKRE